MSLGRVSNNFSTQQTQQARAVAPTPKADESRTTDAQPTNTPTEAQRATPDAATQDAARQLQQGNEGALKDKVQNSLDGWQEAGNRRTRTTTGRRRVAQGTPTRGLGGDGGSEMA